MGKYKDNKKYEKDGATEFDDKFNVIPVAGFWTGSNIR